MIETPREHFSKLDALYINLPQREDRRLSIKQNFDNMFHSLDRREPVVFEDRKQAGIEFKQKLVDTAMNNQDVFNLFATYYMYFPVDMEEFASRGRSVPHGRAKELRGYPAKTATWCPEQYAGHYSLLLTTIGILKEFLASDLDKMVLLEDDAYPRDDFLDAEVRIPDDADILVWGGAVHCNKDDNKAYIKERPFRFRTLRNSKRAWYTTCYEFNRNGAKALLDAFDSDIAATTDTGWLYAFRNCNAYGMKPQGIVQYEDNGMASSNIGVAMNEMIASRNKYKEAA